jgi:putative ABC transport system permease protein
VPLLPRLASLGRTLLRRSRLDAELDDELDGYLDALTRKKIAGGMEPDAARRAAVLEAGGVESLREEVRNARIGSGIEAALRDVRYAWRGLWKAPGFAFATVATLALGIGANAAIFSVVDAMLLSPLPYRDSSRLVFVWSDMSEAGYPRAPLSGPELADLRRRGSLFTGFGAIWSNTAALTGDRDPEQLRIGLVTPDFFSTLGAEAAFGRTFAAGDDAPGASPSILLGSGLWKRRFGGDSRIVGERILVNGQPTTVIGVMPERFRLWMPPDASVPDDLDAWMPFWPKMADGPRGQQFLRVVGRMKNGVTLDEASRQIESIAGNISREFTEYGSAGRRFNLVGLHADGVREIRPMLVALFGGVAILLLITCVNVAGLLVARAASRRREFAVRTALGAGRRHLLRQCLAEGLVLSVLGGVAGMAVAKLVLGALVAARPESLDRISAARIDPRVLAFTGGTALVWGLILSLAPLAEVLRNSAAASNADRLRAGRAIRSRARAALVVVQVALGAVLLVGAGLVARTFLSLQHVDPGFRSEGSLSFRIALPNARTRTPDGGNAFARRLEAELAALPGVAAVGGISHLPYDHLPNWGGPYLAAAGADESTAPQADYRSVTPGLFDALGARLVEGRGFTEADDPSGDPVAVVDERLARRAWPGGGAVGKRLAVDPFSSGHPTTEVTVVGVVRHMRHRTLAAEIREQVYFPQRQILRNPMAYVLRAKGGGTAAAVIALAAPLRQAVARLDPQLPVYDVRPFSEYLAAASGAQRFAMIVAAAFAGAALLLACVGLYGVVAYSVAQRRSEFSVRLAVGAMPRQVRGLVVGEAMRLAAAGILLGAPAAILGARLLRSQLFGVTPHDPASYAIALAVLAAAAVAAAWLAARRAIAGSPFDVLRSD